MRFVPVLAAPVITVAVLASGCRDSNTAYSTNAEVCGAPPTNVEQELTHQAEVEIDSYVQGGTGAGNKRKLTQVLSQQGLMCDALAYRACMAAHSAEASAEQMQDMLRLAWDSCAKQQQAQQAQLPQLPEPAPGPPEPAPQPQPTPSPAGADTSWRPGVYMGQAVGIVVDSAQRVEKQTSLGFDGDASCVLGAYIKKGGRITMSRPFIAGKKYAILGGGAEGTQDLDLALQAPDGTIVAADTEDDARPVLEFTVPTDASYRIILALPKAAYDGTFAAIALMKEGGYRIPPANITRSFGSTMEAAARASRVAAQKWPQLSGLVFHEEDDWSFFGTILLQGESIGFSGIELKSQASIVLASHDGKATNLDLSVQDQNENDRVVSSDTDPDANPLVVVNPTIGHTYRIEISAPATDGPSLVTTLLLDAK
jgi:hypothetical protein